MHPSIHSVSSPEKAAIVSPPTGERLSYSDLESFSNQGAHLFRSLGLKRGDTVALVMRNGFDFFEVAWAAQRAGLFYTCISTRLTPGEVAYIVADSGAAVLVASDALLALEVQASLPSLLIYASGDRVDGVADFRQARAKFPKGPIGDESPGIDLLYSSGTTGKPKGIQAALPTGSLNQSDGLTDLSVARFGLGEESVFLITAPVYHSAPLRFAMTVQKLGGTVVLMDKFDAEDSLRCIEQYEVTHSLWVPTHFVRLLKLDRGVRERYDLSSLKIAIHAAAPCPVPVKRAMIEWWGPIIYEYYAGTEANGMTLIGPEEWLEHPGSVGRAVWGSIRICNEAGELLPTGEVGVIYFADGPSFAYRNDPQKTKASRNAEGWSTLGDVGRVDDEGYLYLTDRLSYTIISGGVNIYPQELEDLLVTHEKVADVAVIGAPDEEMGEKVVAVVQPANPAEAGPELAFELMEWLKPRIGRLKQPRQIDFSSDLPRHPTGKLYKRLLRDQYWKDQAVS